MNADELRSRLRLLPMYADKTDAELDSTIEVFVDNFGSSDIDPQEMTALLPHILDEVLTEARGELSGFELVAAELVIRGFQDLLVRVNAGDPSALNEAQQMWEQLFDDPSS